MKIIKILMALIIILPLSLNTKAQTDILEKLNSIKVMSSTRADVEKLFDNGKDENNWTWYMNTKESVRIVYSTSECTRGFSAPKDTVVECLCVFSDRKKTFGTKKES